MNKFYELRKDKDREPETEYTRSTAIAYEIEAIGINITFQTQWEKLLPGQKIFNARIKLLTNRDYKTKKGAMMSYATVLYDGIQVPAIVFPKAYKSYSDFLMPGLDLIISGSRSKEKDELIIDTIRLAEDDKMISAPIIDPLAGVA